MNIITLLQQYPSIAWIALPIVGVMAWLRYRHSSFRLSQGRKKDLKALLTKRSWEKSHPLTLQLAVNDVLGQMLDDRWISLALRRHRPWQLLIDCKRAFGLVKSQENGQSFVDTKSKRWLSHRAWAITLSVLAVLPIVPLWAVVAFKLTVTPQVGVELLMPLVMWTPFSLWLSGCMWAAHRLVHELDQRHPLIRELPKVTDPNG